MYKNENLRHQIGNLNTETKPWWSRWTLHSLESQQTYFPAFLYVLRIHSLAAHAPERIKTPNFFFSFKCVRLRILRRNHSEISNAINYGLKRYYVVGRWNRMTVDVPWYRLASTALHITYMSFICVLSFCLTIIFSTTFFVSIQNFHPIFFFFSFSFSFFFIDTEWLLFCFFRCGSW